MTPPVKDNRWKAPIAVSCVIAAVVLLLHGSGEWGWFLFVAALCT